MEDALNATKVGACARGGLSSITPDRVLVRRHLSSCRLVPAKTLWAWLMLGHNADHPLPALGCLAAPWSPCSRRAAIGVFRLPNGAAASKPAAAGRTWHLRLSCRAVAMEHCCLQPRITACSCTKCRSGFGSGTALKSRAGRANSVFTAHTGAQHGHPQRLKPPSSTGCGGEGHRHHQVLRTSSHSCATPLGSSQAPPSCQGPCGRLTMPSSPRPCTGSSGGGQCDWGQTLISAGSDIMLD